MAPFEERILESIAAHEVWVSLSQLQRITQIR